MKLVNQPGPQWQVHDLGDNPEHDLFESIITEQNDIYGFEILYYRYDQSKEMDTLYGEDQTAQFLTPKRTKLTYSPTEEVRIADMFGLVGDEAISYLQMPRYTFRRDVIEDLETLEEPIAGDVIHFLWNSISYEVVDVGLELNIFQNRKFSYEMRVKPYRYAEQSTSHEEALSTDNTAQVSAWGDNEWIEEESNNIDNYTNVDETIYGY
jgi:hypothetical protein